MYILLRFKKKKSKLKFKQNLNLTIQYGSQNFNQFKIFKFAVLDIGKLETEKWLRYFKTNYL